jgi:coenzyme F420-0:L-glutamate ligase/coenzyme F420-1:gamma-L-glutamate ligase
MSPGAISIEALAGIGEIAAGDDLAQVIGAAMAAPPPGPSDVLVVAQKIVSKAEGRLVRLADVTVSARAAELAAQTGKDPRLVELILAESSEVLRAAPNLLIVRHRLGLVMANAGIDQSNIGEGDDAALLLPLDPDASAARLRQGLMARFAAAPAVIVSDSFGRPWRMGTVNVAIGTCGLPSWIDLRGQADRSGRILRASEIAFADAIAAAAGLVMGEAAEGRPAVLVRGLAWSAPERDAKALLRPLEQDLFR